MGLKPLFTNKILILFVILIIGASFRFYKLDFRSLWYDEAEKINSATHQYTLKEFSAQKDVKIPVFLFLLKFWIKLFGHSEYALRSLSTMFGILSIFSLYMLASEFFSETIGLFASFFLSISPFHIYYSQQSTEYSLLLLWVILSMLIFVKIYKSQKIVLYLLYAIVNILLCYTHIFGFHIIILHNFCLLLFKKRNFFKKGWLITQGVLISFILPLLILIFYRGQQINEIDWISKPNISVFIDLIKAISYGGEKLIQGGVGLAVEGSRLLFARLLMLVYGLLIFRAFFPNKNYLEVKKHLFSNNFLYKQKIVLLFMWIAFPVLITYIFSVLVFPVFVVRYYITILPAFLIFFSMGISSYKSSKTTGIILCLILILNLQALWVHFHPEKRDSWREIAACVKEEISPEDMIIFTPSKQIAPFIYYFSNDPIRFFQIIEFNKKGINGLRKTIFRENNYIYAGVALGDLPYEMMNTCLFKISEKKANKIFLIASPNWPGIGQCVPIVRDYFLKNGWKETEFFYVFPGANLFIYKK